MVSSAPDLVARERVVLLVECLTPVHVGSGEALRLDVDYFSASGVTHVLDPERVGEALAGLDALADQLATGVGDRRGFSIGDAIARRKVDPVRLGLYPPVAGKLEASRLRRGLRSADGRLLIPGSTIKGALRTLLLAAWANEDGPHTGRRTRSASRGLEKAAANRGKSRFLAQPLEQEIFRVESEAPRLRRQDAQSDVLRMLAVSDAAFPEAALDVVSSKAVGTNRNTLTAVEALRPSARALVTLRVGDGFVEGKPPFSAAHRLPSFHELARLSHAHAKHLLEGDRDYFRQNPVAASLADRCDQLLARIRSGREGELFLRLGWGTGWRTMTGDLLTPEERARFAGRVGKTRKVVLDGHGRNAEPRNLFGWVRLARATPEDVERILAEAAPAPRRAAPPSVVSATADEPRITVDVFAQAIEALRPKDFGRISALIAEAEGAPGVDERARRLRLLAGRVRELFWGDKKLRKRLRELPALAPYLEE
jgi:CRISPR-associated protein Csm5